MGTKTVDGSNATFEKIKRLDSVNVFPVKDNGKIVLTRQVQPGLPEMVAAIGGIVDDGEEVFDAAKRELMEEFGIVAGRWQLWDRAQPLVTIDWAISSFIARKCKVVAKPKLDSGEKIELFEVGFDEFVDVV